MNGNEILRRSGYEQPKAGRVVKPGQVRALLRKDRQESRSGYRTGQFDFLGFLLRLVLVGAIVALFVVFFGQFTGIYLGIRTAGKTDIYSRANELFTMLYTAVIVGMVIGGVGQLGHELFDADDIRLYSGMPIGAKSLFAAKLIIIYRKQLLIALVAVLTVNGTFALHAGVTLAFWVLTLGICFLLPLITIAIASLLVLPYRVVKRFLRERYVLLFLAVTVLLGCGFYLYSLVLGGVKQLLLGDSVRYFFNERVMGAIGKTCTYLYPARWFAQIMTGSEPVVSWVFLLLVMAGCLLVSMLIINAILTRALQARNAGYAGSVLRTESLASKSGKLTALLKKEFLLIFRTPSYMFSYFSVAFVMPLMVYFCMDVGASLVENLVGLESNLELAIFLTVLFGALTNIFCATNISRDGEMFYTVKAMPIGWRTVFLSKVILCMLVLALSQLASAVLLYATGNVGLIDALFIFAVGVLFGFVNVAVATRYDFNHAKFSTEDDGEIKESSGTVSTVIVLGMLLSFAVGGLVFVLKLLSRLRGFEYGALTYILAGSLAGLSAVLALVYLTYRLKRKYYEFSGGGI